MAVADAELVAQSQNGDREAFAELVRRYQNKIYCFIYRALQHREEAQDVTQEVFLRAFRALSQYTRDQSFAAWLFKIANNLCLDSFRRKKLKTVPIDGTAGGRDDESTHYEIPDNTNNPELLFANLEIRRAVEEAIAALPYRYRVVTILRHLQDLSYQEISAITGQPEGTVKAQIFRARRLLREKLRAVG